MKRILKFVLPFKWLFIAGILLNFLFSFLSVISITLIKPIFEIIFETTDKSTAAVENIGVISKLKDWFFNWVMNLVVIENAEWSVTLIRFGVIIFIIFLLKNIVKYVAVITNARCEENIIKYVRDTIFVKLNELSIEFFNRKKMGDLMSLIANDVSSLNINIINTATTFFRDLIQVILYIFLLLSISIKLVGITLVAGIFILLIVRLSTKYLKRYATRIQQAMSNFTTTLSEMLSGIRIVKAFNAEQTSISRFKNDTIYYLKSAIKFKKISEIIPVMSELSAIFSLCVVLLQGGQMVLDGEMNSSDLMLFLFAVFAIMAPLLSVTTSISSFQKGFVAANRIFNLLAETSNVKDGHKNEIAFNDCIEFKNVTFKYNDFGKNILTQISFKINKGEQIAFVGSSGSGKSTILDLLIRFYDANEGEILIDGINIKEYNTKIFRSLFGVVSQENILFNDTIHNNIIFGYKNYTQDDLINATKTSNCYNFITNTQNGFDTTIGDRGINISGGERQRIAIARALLRNPNILIFDEATSALDAESEKLVQSAINNSLQTKTAILVAHRLSTIINCDRIYIIDNGKIVETGKHTELLSQNGYYANLWNLQFKND